MRGCRLAVFVNRHRGNVKPETDHDLSGGRHLTARMPCGERRYQQGSGDKEKRTLAGENHHRRRDIRIFAYVPSAKTKQPRHF